MKILDKRPTGSDQEIAYMVDALKNGQICGDGYYTRQVENWMKERFNCPHVFMTTSATHALEMAAILGDLMPEDEVIMPSFTFSSTACAVMLRGAKPVFAEIKEDTLNIDGDDLEQRISPKTKAIIPMHYAGIGCEMDKIMDVAQSRHLFVIEDAAQAVNAKYKGKYLGTWGHFGCYSFHGTKNISCGEGGALLTTLTDKRTLAKAEAVRQKGTNRDQFIQGNVKKYTWVEIGSSYTPSDLLMALLLAQFNKVDAITGQRKKVFNSYYDGLKKYEQKGILRLPSIPADCEPNYHIFYVIFSSEIIRDQVMKELAQRGIAASAHYSPLHSSPMGLKLGYKAEDLKITEKISRCLLRLPIHEGLTEVELDYVLTNIGEVLEVL